MYIQATKITTKTLKPSDVEVVCIKRKLCVITRKENSWLNIGIWIERLSETLSELMHGWNDLTWVTKHASTTDENSGLQENDWTCSFHLYMK